MLVLALYPWVTSILAALFLFFCVLLILAVLIQRPTGGGLSGAFGSGAGSGQTAFGAKTGDALTYATITIFTVYLLFAVGLNYASKPATESGAATPASRSGTATTGATGSTGSSGATGPAPAGTPSGATGSTAPAAPSAPLAPAETAPAATPPAASTGAPASTSGSPQPSPGSQPG